MNPRSVHDMRSRSIRSASGATGPPFRGIAWMICLIGMAALGCGGSAPPVADTLDPPPQQPPPVTEYRLQVGDEINVRVVGQAEFSGQFAVRPDGKISTPGAGELEAIGRTVPELAEEIRARLRRLIRYPDVSVMLASHATHVVYIFGEVGLPGTRPHVPNMTALHALAASGGPTTTAKLNSVLVLRRSGPADVDIYRIDLEAPTDGETTAPDIYLEPFDVVYVPRTLIGEVNIFVDQFIRKNIAPFTAYIEGWRAFHIDELKTVVR